MVRAVVYQEVTFVGASSLLIAAKYVWRRTFSSVKQAKNKTNKPPALPRALQPTWLCLTVCSLGQYDDKH